MPFFILALMCLTAPTRAQIENREQAPFVVTALPDPIEFSLPVEDQGLWDIVAVGQTVFASARDAGRIWAFDQTDNSFSNWRLPGEHPRPTLLAIDTTSSDGLWILDEPMPSVGKLDANLLHFNMTDSTFCTIPLGLDTTDPTWLELDDSGNPWISDGHNSALIQYDVASENLSLYNYETQTTASNSPADFVSFAVSENMAYILDAANAKVVSYNITANEFISHVEVDALDPTGIARSSSGETWIADPERRSVLVTRESGDGTTYLTSGSPSPHSEDTKSSDLLFDDSENLWFVHQSRQAIVAICPTSDLLYEYDIQIEGVQIEHIHYETTSSYVWFTDNGANAIGYIQTAEMLQSPPLTYNNLEPITGRIGSPVLFNFEVVNQYSTTLDISFSASVDFHMENDQSSPEFRPVEYPLKTGYLLAVKGEFIADADTTEDGIYSATIFTNVQNIRIGIHTTIVLQGFGVNMSPVLQIVTTMLLFAAIYAIIKLGRTTAKT